MDIQIVTTDFKKSIENLYGQLLFFNHKRHKS